MSTSALGLAGAGGVVTPLQQGPHGELSGQQSSHPSSLSICQVSGATAPHTRPCLVEQPAKEGSCVGPLVAGAL